MLPSPRSVIHNRTACPDRLLHGAADRDLTEHLVDSAYGEEPA